MTVFVKKSLLSFDSQPSRNASIFGLLNLKAIVGNPFSFSQPNTTESA